MSNKAEIREAVLEFKGSHHYRHQYELTKYFCPNCGNRGSVWENMGVSDYYLGSSYVCTSCCHESYLDNTVETTSPEYVSVIAQIREGAPIVPTTKEGN